jgi:hypothetical protein
MSMTSEMAAEIAWETRVVARRRSISGEVDLTGRRWNMSIPNLSIMLIAERTAAIHR